MTSWFADGLLGRIFRNAGMLMSGRAASGAFGLITLGLMARGLGPEVFGIVVLVQTYAFVVTGLTTFQSWQALIKYGAEYVQRQDLQGFHALVRFTTFLDVLGVVAGTAIAVAAIPWIGPYLDWTADVMIDAQFYCLVILFSVAATPTGILRLQNRFDLLSIQSAIAPALRAVGVTVAFLADAGITGYLAAWFFAGAVAGIAFIALGWREGVRSGLLTGMSWRGGVKPPEAGMWGFALASNFNSSLVLIPNQMATVLVGLVATPAAAGVYKIARDVSTALTKPAEMLNQSIYPEFAKLGSRDDWHQFARLILRGGALAGGAGVFVLIVLFVAGGWFIDLAFGAAFSAAHPVMLLLVGAATLTIAGFSMEPALFAMGRPGLPLRVNTVTVLGVFLPVLVVAGQDHGALAGGMAALAASTISFVALAVFTLLELRKRK
jgi:O-antigen/teichoic acid export membrane protein